MSETTTVKFKAEYLRDVLDLPQDVGDYPAVVDAPAMTVHENRILGLSRWSVKHEMVFSLASGPHANKPGEAWRVKYQHAATEVQDEGPWENEDEVKATLVHAEERRVMVWEPVK